MFFFCQKQLQPNKDVYFIIFYFLLFLFAPSLNKPQTAIANELFNLNNYWPCRQAGQLVFPLSIVVYVKLREHRLGIGDMSGLCGLLHEKEW